MRLVEKVSCKWLEFGLAVRVDMNCLKSWERQYREDANRCWLEVMGHWLNAGGTDNYPTTWEGLCVLLRDVGYGEVASTLEKALSSIYLLLSATNHTNPSST